MQERDAERVPDEVVHVPGDALALDCGSPLGQLILRSPQRRHRRLLPLDRHTDHPGDDGPRRGEVPAGVKIVE
jgi:hypothetical protein